MSFTDLEIECLVSHLKSAGFEVPSDWDNERIGMLATCVLEALNIYHE